MPIYLGKYFPKTFYPYVKDMMKNMTNSPLYRINFLPNDRVM